VNVTLELRGYEKIRDELLRQSRVCPPAAAAMIYGFGTRVMRDSVKRAPSLTGELKRSAYVTIPQASSQHPSVEIGYGSHHAVPVHEETEVAHDDGEAKFLQRALDAARGGALQQMGRDFLAALKSNGGLPKSEFPVSPHVGPEHSRHPGARSSALRDRIRRSR
jgi:hypothetical protein